MTQGESPVTLIYDLEDRPPVKRTMAYGAQWLVFMLANSAVVPVVVGSALGLDQGGIADFAQRILFLSGLASLLQVLFGHRLPIPEGPAGMWWGVFITLAYMAPVIGKPLPVLRTDLEAGLLAAGVVLALIGASGLMSLTLKLFTPAVTGTVLVLLGIQLSATFVRGMLGVDAPGDSINLKSAALSAFVVMVVFLVTLKGRGFLRSVAILVGILAGWLASVPVGLYIPARWGGSEIIKLPAILAWGQPTLDPGILFTSVITGVLVLSNLVASILAMEKTIDRKFSGRVYSRGVVFTGLADIMAGLGATLGFVPFSAGAGMVTLTGVAARVPFIVFTLALMLLSLFPPVGIFLSSIPGPVGYSVLLASFAQMLGFGIRDYLRLKLDARDLFVVGTAILFGTGVMFLPPEALKAVPGMGRYILGNGFITGMLLVILLEHLILPASRFSRTGG